MTLTLIRNLPCLACCLLSLLLSVGPAGADEAPTILLSLSSADDEQASVTIMGLRGKSVGTTETLDVITPWEGLVALDPSTPVRFEIDGYWAAPIVWQEGQREAQVVLQPAGIVRLEPPKDLAGTLPEVWATFQQIGRHRAGRDQLPSHRVLCPAEEGSWTCQLPTGRLDLQLSLGGYASQYFWNLAVDTEKQTLLEADRWQRGGSVQGWLVNRGGDELVAQISVSPEIVGTPADPGLQRRDGLRAVHTDSDTRGFFQLGGLAPGAYILKARKEGYDSPEFRFQISRAGEELALQRPIPIAPMATVEVQLDSTVDPWGEGWRIELAQERGRDGTYEHYVSGVANSQGTWRTKKVPAKEYLLSVTDSQGSEWVSDTVTVWHGMGPLFYPIDLVPVSGQLMLGGQGIPGDIVFGSTNGTISISMTADDDGEYSGYLPYEGRWPIDLRLGPGNAVQATEPVQVARPRGKSSATINFDLPATELRGRVLEDGKPARAVVLAIREELTDVETMTTRRKEISLVTDRDDGTFVLRGVSPGPLQLTAYRTDVSSDLQLLQLIENEPLKVSLELRVKRTIEGRLLASDGTTLAGAQIVARPDVGIATGTQSGFDGSFSLQIPAEVSYVDLMILPTGAGFFFQRISMPKDSIKDLVLTAPTTTGNLILANPGQTGHLFFRGIGTRVDRVLGKLVQAGRLGPHPEGGVSLRGLAPGPWSLCPGAFDAESCETIEVLPGGDALIGFPKEGP